MTRIKKLCALVLAVMMVVTAGVISVNAAQSSDSDAVSADTTETAIGERYYELHKDDVENDMANQFQIIADAMEKIAKCEQQIRDIKNENTCPSCGATISKDVLFCPNCGTKIERPQPEPEPQPTEKVCPECGAAVDEDDVFCTNCGARVDSEESSEKDDEQTESEQTDTQQ